MREEKVDIVEAIEGMAQRLEKAKKLAEEGKVRRVEGDESWIVENEGGDKFYLVKDSACTCQDFNLRRNLHKGWCKHRLAVALFKRNQRKGGQGGKETR